ncbi:MAG: TolC family protein [Nitrospirota bacterium]
MKRLPLALALFLAFSPLTARALSLQEGLKIVAETGRDVQIARSDEDVARASVSLARSPWLPWVDVYGRETWLKYQPASVLPFSIPGTSTNSIPVSQDQFLTYGVRATQLLYDFGKTSSSIDAAQNGLKAREIGTDRLKNQAALDFITMYLDLLESQKLLQVAREEVQQYEAHKKDTEARYGAGVVTKNEVLQATVTLADSRQRLLTAENLQSLRESKLNSLLLKPLNDAIQPDEIRASPSAGMTLEDAWISAEASRALLKEMDAAIAAKEQNVKTAQAEYLPTFYVSGGYEYSENRYMVHQDNWSAIAGVNINLSSGGASRSRAALARAELRSLRLSRDKLLDGIRLEVKAAYLDLQSSAQKIEVTKTAVAQAEENLRLQRLRYREGVGTATEVLDAVTLLTTAESNSWKSLYGFKRAEAVLLNAAGKDLVSAYGN